MDSILSSKDVGEVLAQRIKGARLSADLTQQGLAERAGVSLGSLKRFERSGEVSLKNLVRLAFALRLEDGFDALFRPSEYASLDEALKTNAPRRRGRRS